MLSGFHKKRFAFELSCQQWSVQAGHKKNRRHPVSAMQVDKSAGWHLKDSIALRHKRCLLYYTNLINYNHNKISHGKKQPFFNDGSVTVHSSAGHREKRLLIGGEKTVPNFILDKLVFHRLVFYNKEMGKLKKRRFLIWQQ